ncbi:sugar-transfer associated ATP-grasp domain-containing protein [Planctomycetes bacterium K23_9]|uniref:Alpha-L-glutamate ligase-related protein ATP-grasp domain-containing protein n=1 Tax=Stieleria marina TaxID=1930275 RepID=A0A517P2T0_9BACT|nr:hypothetical protein K239x_57000 [Planctomycetes bacterium K23_9]
MSIDQFQFDTAQNSSAVDVMQGMRKAKKAGRGMFGIFLEIAKLRYGKGKLTLEEYFMYELYDDTRYSPEAKRTFLSQHNMMLDSPWRLVAKDKPVLTAMLSGLGLPVPETQALYHANRTVGGAIALRNQNDIHRFLRKQAQYPMFGKPFDRACSLGTARISGYDASSDTVTIGDDSVVTVEKFTEMIQSMGQDYLFQTLMLPHSSISKLIGPSVSSVRMFVITDKDGSSLFRAAWKIPATVNSADNFWRVGNILAGIDVETGKIGRTLTRTEKGTEPIASHPVTGAQFDGMVFPMWEQMKETVLAAAVNLPGCSFQGWDVALTDQGPVIVELEGDGGNPIMEQLCFDSGLLEERYLRIVADGNKNPAKPVSRAPVASQDPTASSDESGEESAPEIEPGDVEVSHAESAESKAPIVIAPVIVSTTSDATTSV